MNSNIRISLGTKFQLKLTILIFWTKFAQKGFFRSKTEKLNTTTEFCIFELIQIPCFGLNSQFLFFRPNLSKKVISGRKLLRVSLLTIKLFHSVTGRCNGISMFLPLLVAEAISNVSVISSLYSLYSSQHKTVQSKMNLQLVKKLIKTKLLVLHAKSEK